MSEKAGPTSIELWKRFETALQEYANAEDWDKVVKVNALMVLALKKAGKPATKSQLVARKALATTHANILQNLHQKKDKLQQDIHQFKGQQDGLAAYQLTRLSGEINDI
ncbi:conserved hypothetical protein [Shewanella sediminis HAW-EB3]|uniref:Uncharacterized protein n=1 Tax=Shewanella sediminis (strain HAW-EB3) TaxID=425104 RepID=A8FP94_SHESH|nr:hypothetical protein [Shewanella sediminis]ABV34667.1 conserved hypothetical protein [Shewanella sediminis HAW-EB3]